MKKIMLKRSILNIRMLFVIVVNFAILFVSLFEYGIITADGKTPGSTYDILTMYTIPFAISSFIIFAGIFPGLPYAFSYLEERNSGYLGWAFCVVVKSNIIVFIWCNVGRISFIIFKYF